VFQPRGRRTLGAGGGLGSRAAFSPPAGRRKESVDARDQCMKEPAGGEGWAHGATHHPPAPSAATHHPTFKPHTQPRLLLHVSPTCPSMYRRSRPTPPSASPRQHGPPGAAPSFGGRGCLGGRGRSGSAGRRGARGLGATPGSSPRPRATATLLRNVSPCGAMNQLQGKGRDGGREEPRAWKGAAGRRLKAPDRAAGGGLTAHGSSRPRLALVRRCTLVASRGMGPKSTAAAQL
jgi:hypothetical protein